QAPAPGPADYAARPRGWYSLLPQGGHPPHHSITCSAPASSILGITMPRAFAVLRLITSSNFVGACTGRSAGLAPRRMRLTYSDARPAGGHRTLLCRLRASLVPLRS